MNQSFIEHSNRTRDLVYTPDFKTFVEKNPKIMKKVRDIISSFMEDYPFTDENYREEPGIFDIEEDKDNRIKVEFFDLNFEGAKFKVTVKDQVFFVKIQDPLEEKDLWHGGQGGVREIKSANNAKDALKDLDFIEFVDYQLAYDYKDSKGNNLRYLVSNWLDYPLLANYLDTNIPESEKEDLWGKLKLIKERLPESEYIDFGDHNCFYDQKRDKIILFDSHNKRIQKR